MFRTKWAFLGSLQPSHEDFFLSFSHTLHYFQVLLTLSCPHPRNPKRIYLWEFSKLFYRLIFSIKYSLLWAALTWRDRLLIIHIYRAQRNASLWVWLKQICLDQVICSLTRLSKKLTHPSASSWSHSSSLFCLLPLPEASQLLGRASLDLRWDLRIGKGGDKGMLPTVSNGLEARRPKLESQSCLVSYGILTRYFVSLSLSSLI